MVKGVSRRDFVRTGAAAALAAAASAETMQGAGAAKTPADALSECIAVMKYAALMPLAKKGDDKGLEDVDVEEWLREKTLSKFKDNFDKWANLETRVKESSAAIGQVAAILARISQRRTIGQSALTDAIKAVKNHCQAGDPKSARPDFVVCPDFPK